MADHLDWPDYGAEQAAGPTADTGTHQQKSIEIPSCNRLDADRIARGETWAFMGTICRRGLKTSAGMPGGTGLLTLRDKLSLVGTG